MGMFIPTRALSLAGALDLAWGSAKTSYSVTMDLYLEITVFLLVRISKEGPLGFELILSTEAVSR